MQKGTIILAIGALIVGIVIGALVFSKTEIKNVQTEDYSNSMKVCEGICKSKGLLPAGVGEDENSSKDTRQQSYDYLCNCLAQPMKSCQSDNDCVADIGYCDVANTRVCLPIKK